MLSKHFIFDGPAKYHSLEFLRRLKILKQKEWSLVGEAQRALDHYTILGNCPPTPPLSQHFALSKK